MSRSWYLRLLIIALVLAVSEAETCVKKYEDNTEKQFTCDTCCGEEYTRHCCLPPVTTTDDGSTLSYVYIVIIVFAILAVAAIVFCIVLAYIMYRNKTSDKATINYVSSQPPTIVVHEENVEGNNFPPPVYDNKPGYYVPSGYDMTPLHGTTPEDGATSGYDTTPSHVTTGHCTTPADDATPGYSVAPDLNPTGEVYIDTDIVEEIDPGIDDNSGYNAIQFHGDGHIDTDMIESTDTM